VVEYEDDILEHLSLPGKARASAAELLLRHGLYGVLRCVNGWPDEDRDRVAERTPVEWSARMMPWARSRSSTSKRPFAACSAASQTAAYEKPVIVVLGPAPGCTPPTAAHPANNNALITSTSAASPGAGRTQQHAR
jgi:hypothetical protein